jgi:hypothetical protein
MVDEVPVKRSAGTGIQAEKYRRSRAYDNGNYVRAAGLGRALWEDIIFRYQMAVRILPMMSSDNNGDTKQDGAKGMKCRSIVGYEMAGLNAVFIGERNRPSLGLGQAA